MHTLVPAFILIALLAACAPSNTAPDRTVAFNSTDPLGKAGVVQGNVQVIAQGDGLTRVQITLTGLTPNTRHATHIHVGSCTNQGAVVVPLTEVSADANGTGQSTTSVEAGKIPVAAYVNVHERASNDAAGVGGGIACATIK
jgi:CHRD domain